jgi:serine/threonine protein kinase
MRLECPCTPPLDPSLLCLPQPCPDLGPFPACLPLALLPSLPAPPSSCLTLLPSAARQVTVAADTYSFGCLLLAACNGAHPYDGCGLDVEQLLAAVRAGTQPRLGLTEDAMEELGEAGQWMEMLVKKCLQQDPCQRLPMHEVVEVLDWVQAAYFPLH